MSGFSVVALTAQAAIISAQEIIFSDFEKREEEQNYNYVFVMHHKDMSMQNLMSADFRTHSEYQKTGGGEHLAEIFLWANCVHCNNLPT